MQEKFCLSTLQDSLKEEMVKAGLRRADVGVTKNGPIITVSIGFEPRILWSEFYRDETIVRMRRDISSFSHHSARLASDIYELEQGVIQILVNTVPDYCTEKRVLKAITEAISLMSKSRKRKDRKPAECDDTDGPIKDLLNDEDNTPILD